MTEFGKILSKLSFCIVLASLLSGCLAVAAGGTAGYLVAKDKGPVGTYTSDSIITSTIKAKYVAEDSIKSFDIAVSTHEGIVSLSGEVTSHAVRYLAIKIAQETKGVKRVKANNLEVI